MDTWVISLGGSRIVPDDVDEKFLRDFEKLVNSNKQTKFVVVTGGGSTARRYIDALKKLGGTKKELSFEGIAVTRFHAKFMTRFFGKEANEDVPKNMKAVKNMLKRNQVVFCGALRYEADNTTDGTAAQLANYLDCSFINLTDVKGLYTKNPKKYKSAKLISKISWRDFYSVAKKIKFEAGQHFVLDQKGAKGIMENKIETFIVGSLKQIDNILKDKKFMGTRIYG